MGLTMLMRESRGFFAARDLYHWMRHRDRWRAERARRALYRPFVNRGDLAFDIGANTGRAADALLALGACVVAVEPNPRLAGELRRRNRRSLRVEESAVGATIGTAKLHLGKNPDHSTVSDAWLERAPTSGRWEGTIVTGMTTLDALIEKYGIPAFVKIDVEGYDAEVLAGLSVPLEALSFEYQGSFPEVAERCLQLLGNGWEYALTKEDGTVFVRGWTSADEVVDAVRSSSPDMWGDVFARKKYA